MSDGNLTTAAPAASAAAASSTSSASASSSSSVPPVTPAGGQTSSFLNIDPNLLGGYEEAALETYREPFGEIGPIDSPIEILSSNARFPGSIFTVQTLVEQKVKNGPYTMNKNALVGVPFFALSKLDKHQNRQSMSVSLHRGSLEFSQLFLERAKSEQGTGEWRGKQATLSHDNTVRGDVPVAFLPLRYREEIQSAYDEMCTVITNPDHRPYRIEGGTLVGDNPKGKVTFRMFLFADWIAWLQSVFDTDPRGKIFFILFILMIDLSSLLSITLQSLL